MTKIVTTLLVALGQIEYDNPDIEDAKKARAVAEPGQIFKVAAATADKLLEMVPAVVREPTPAQKAAFAGGDEPTADDESDAVGDDEYADLIARAEKLGLKGAIKSWKRATLKRKVEDAEGI